MKEWFVYQADANHIGPVSTDLLARGVLSGKVSRDAHVGSKGDPAWKPISQVPEIVAEIAKLEGKPIPPRPLSSIPPAPPPPANEPPTFRDMTEAMPRPPAVPTGVAPTPPARPAPPAAHAPMPPAGPAPAAVAPSAPPPAPAPAPVAVAPAPAPAPVPAAPAPVAAAPAPAAAAPAGEKKEEKKAPPLDPRFKFLPVGIFAVAALISVALFVVALVVKPGQPKEAPPAGSAATTTAPAK